MYIELTNEKGNSFTVMTQAIVYFEDQTAGSYPQVNGRILLTHEAFLVEESSADIKALLDALA